jgi:hypothetical protein
MSKGNKTHLNNITPNAQTRKSSKGKNRSEKKPQKHSFILSPFDKFSIFWLALSGWIHVFLEGTFVFNHAVIKNSSSLLPSSIGEYWKFYGESLPKENGFLLNLAFSFVEFMKSLWSEYSCGDSRYAKSDPFVVGVEGVTAVFAGPLCFLLIYSIVFKKPYRHLLQVFLCTLQLYGLVLYFLTEHLKNYEDCQTSSIKCFYFFYWFFNLLWLFMPLMFLIQSAIHIYNLFNKNFPHKKSDAKEIALFLLKLFLGSNAIGISFILFGTIGSHLFA